MYEGLIVVSEDDRTLKFANYAAICYLKQMPEKENSKKEDKTKSINQIDDTDLQRPQFNLEAVSIVNDIIENEE